MPSYWAFKNQQGVEPLKHQWRMERLQSLYSVRCDEREDHQTLIATLRSAEYPLVEAGVAAKDLYSQPFLTVCSAISDLTNTVEDAKLLMPDFTPTNKDTCRSQRTHTC